MTGSALLDAGIDWAVEGDSCVRLLRELIRIPTVNPPGWGASGGAPGCRVFARPPNRARGGRIGAGARERRCALRGDR